MRTKQGKVYFYYYFMIVIEILSSKSSDNQVETGLFIKNIGQIDRYKCQRNPQAGKSLETASPDVECVRSVLDILPVLSIT